MSGKRQGFTRGRGPQGQMPGPQGNSFVWRGTYAAPTQYIIRDVVFYNGSSYIALKSNLGITPANDHVNWDLMAQKGDTGGGGSGGITGPGTSTIGDIVTWNSTTGAVVADSRVSITTTLGADDLTVPTSKAVKDVTDTKQAIITGAATTITSSNLTVSRALVSDGSGKVAVSAVTATELGYVSGVTSAIQTQINGKQATITGAATTITSSDLATNLVLISNGSGKVAVSSVTTTTLGYLDATSSIQTQLNAKQATITGAATTIVSSDLTASRAVVSDGSGKIAVSSVTSTELGYVSGVTSAIQTQINAKQATITGAATTITTSDLTVSRALVSDGSGKVAVATTTATEIGYVNGVTSAIQTQLNGKQATITGAATTITSSNLSTNLALISDGSGKVAVSAVTATELGYVSGVTSAIQTQLNTKMSASSTNTVTNKRMQPRVYSTTSTATLTPEIDTYDCFTLTAQAAALNIANHSTSTPADFEKIQIRILDNGTARAITYGSNYVARAGVALPSTTVVNKLLEMGFEWNAAISKYVLLASGQEA